MLNSFVQIMSSNCQHGKYSSKGKCFHIHKYEEVGDHSPIAKARSF
jgi:hypothetical protein